MSTGPRIVVLGAGISGLAAAKEVQALGFTPQVIEACPSVGGLTRTTTIDEFSFDYTGHFLHLAQHESPAAVPHADLKDADWQRINRRAYAYLDGAMVPTPVQYHLGDLPEPLRTESITSYEARPAASGPASANLREWVVSGFGETLAARFLIPQNEKTMAVSLDRLSTSGVRRFFPPPSEPQVRQGMVAGAKAAATYNSQFWYPKVGGIELLAAGLAGGVERIERFERVVAVDLVGRTVRCASGRTWAWDRLLSSIPLKLLCQLTADDDLGRAAQRLTHSTTVSFSVGLKGPLPGVLGDAQWIYVPDLSVPFYRVGIYSNISAGMCPVDRAALYVEVGLPSEAMSETDIVRDLQPRVMAALNDLGWAPSEQVMCSVMHVIKCAYVHHTHDAEDVVAGVLSRLESESVFSIGRYGRWDYISMEDSILSGISGARRAALS